MTTSRLRPEPLFVRIVSTTAAALLLSVACSFADDFFTSSNGFSAYYQGGHLLNHFDANGNALAPIQGALNFPKGAAFDSSGNLYLANTGQGNVRRIDAVGADTIFATIPGARDVAFDAAGNLYVAAGVPSDNASNKVEKFSSVGVDLGRFDQAATGAVGAPNSLAFDAAGNLYVGYASNNVVKYSSAGADLGTFANDTTGVNGPLGMACDSGFLYVANFNGNSVTKYDTAASTFPVAATATYTGTNINKPLDVAFDSSHVLYVSNQNTGKIEKFDSASASPGTDLGTFANTGSRFFPWGLAFKGNDLYAVGGNHNEVRKFDSTLTNPVAGTLFFRSHLAFPSGIALASNGEMYVANSGLDTIDKFNSAGEYIGIFASTVGPTCIAFDGSGNLFVAHYFDNTVTKLDSNGAETAFASGFNGPNGLALDRDGNLYVSNEGTGTDSPIEKFSPDGLTRTTFAATGPYPEGLAFDGSGNLYVAIYGASNPTDSVIKKFDPSGIFIDDYAKNDPGGDPVLNGPTGLAFDSAGNLYAVNNGPNPNLGATGFVTKVDTSGGATVFAEGLNNGAFIAARRGPAIATTGSRVFVSTGEAVSVEEFTLQGTGPKDILLRGIGLSGNFANKLQDGFAELRDASGTLIEANDNWHTGARAAEIESFGLQPGSNSEPAILRTLNPGTYTFVLRGRDGTTGTASAELYDLSDLMGHAHNGILSAVSERALVAGGDNLIIGGLSLQGGFGSQQVLIRVLGPSLSVPGALSDPLFTLYDQNGAIAAASDDWQSEPNAAAVTATGFAPSQATESAAIIDLPAGNYTAVVQGKNGTTGIAFLQTYTLPYSHTALDPAPVVASAEPTPTPTATPSPTATPTPTSTPTPTATPTTTPTPTATASPTPTPLEAPVITSATSATTTVGQQFAYQIVASNNPDTYAATNLPAGLSFDTTTGVISGEPTEAGSTEVALSATNSAGTGTATLTITVQAAPAPNTPVITSGTSTTARTNNAFSFQITASGVTSDATVTSSALPPGLTLNSATGLISGTPTTDGSFQVTLTLHDGEFSVTGTLQLTFTSDPAFPVITSPPEVHLVAGEPFTYTITAPGDGSEPATFTLSGTLPPGLTFDPATGTISGTYNPPAGAKRKGGSRGNNRLGAPSGSVIETVTITAHNSHGTATAQLTFLVPLPTAAINVSTRGLVGTGENVLIGGFIVTGSAPKKVVVRAIGPSLNVNGEPVPGTLQDPVLELYDVDGNLIESNDDWATDNEQAINDSTVAPTDSHESAIVRALVPGNYTAKVRGKEEHEGVALVEVYDLDTENAARLAQISTRGNVQKDDNVLIGGFIIGGDAAANVLVRAIGPELTDKGVANALENTTLELRDLDGGLLASNDDWKSDQEQAITDTTVPPTDDREAAILQSLAAGQYTAIVRGKANSTGIGLVEVYVLK